MTIAAFNFELFQAKNNSKLITFKLLTTTVSFFLEKKQIYRILL